MTTFIISCEGDRETGISGQTVTVQFDLPEMKVNKGNIRKLKKGLAEAFQECWNAGPVRIRKVKEIPG